MLDVIFTVDVEVWGDGRHLTDEAFPAQFDKCIFGTTAAGSFGLPYQFQVLNDHGLSGVFFVEPLFATRFGNQPLADIIGLIRDAGQEVQLHLHTEWVHRAKTALLTGPQTLRKHLRAFTHGEQEILIAAGKQLLQQNGAADVDAFRAGSFGFNRDTLGALAANDIAFDSSYNATMFGPDSGVLPGEIVTEPVECNGVFEYPVTVFRDGSGRLRHLQVTACSFDEIEAVLWKALESGRSACVVVFHSFELLDIKRQRVDRVVLRRFRKLCAFLERHGDVFRVAGFKGREPKTVPRQPAPLAAGILDTGVRLLEQAYRKLRV